jgi:preprotein translocase subunit SecF
MQLFPLRLLPENTSINFIKLSKINYLISILIIIVSFGAMFFKSFNYGIDFIGGISIDVRSTTVIDVAKMRKVLGALDLGEAMIQNYGEHNDVSIRIAARGDADLNSLVSSIKQTIETNFAQNIEYRKIDFVGPQIGRGLIISGFQAVTLAFLAIMVYVWFRFEWQFGLGVLLSLIHDAIACLGFMSLTQLDFNLSTVAAILTVIGYSVNDSVVIYDRIRENLRKYHNKNVQDIINISINDTLSRTTLTVLTTLLANFALIIFGGEALRSFSLLVFFGIVMGTYSSIFVSAPILTLFNLKRFTKKTQ